VALTEALGSDIVVHFTVDAPRIRPDGLDRDAVDDVALGTRAGSTPFVARFSPRTRVTAGDAIDVAVDTSRLHFFDPTTGLAIRA
jgi:multiple sugar transport system ATP-binding protein